MSEGKIIEIYNQGISQVIETIKLLSNQISLPSFIVFCILNSVRYIQFGNTMDLVLIGHEY